MQEAPAGTASAATAGSSSGTHRLRGAAVLLAVFAAGLTRVSAPDTFWLLRAGELIVATRTLPTRDSFSYTSQGPWLNAARS